MPKKVSFIHEMMVHRFKAIAIDKFDPRITHLLEDPHIPDFQEICGIYCIYSKSILDFLNNKYCVEFPQKERSVPSEDFDYVLDSSTIVVISSKDGMHISDYYIGGRAKRLESILNVCLGSPTSKEMEFLDNLLNEGDTP